MADDTQMEEPSGSILTALDELAETAPEKGLSLRQLFDALDERAFGAILFALALPCCIPFLYAVPQIVSLPMAAIAFQMVLGRSEPWLPEKFADRRIDKAGLERIARSGRRFFGWAEKIVRPRLTFLASSVAERIVGALLCLFCGSIMLPFPLTNTTPGFAVALVAFGLMARDGLMMIVGMIIGTSWIGMLVILGPVALKEAVKAILAMVGIGS
ncbi:exopolysaccharide biosynthesis protein [Ponticaulis sp.]|uniref:exopolysaccharide biosynthesis protein n=1 Tax=Ponticaulis sp. TaxID=2020902 RepID=UPI000B6F0CF6|nr:exopolysaccharide biosynthesis protein [Ponticaulis sp.]OUX97187.1 MAG: polysaccharide synthesis protein exod [Hyphomonadaceae bacterium TMED5]|tara:strand:+ start:9459 stop:10100 length:642 start_codon:yes stop_codon:yes gene_type:complete